MFRRLFVVLATIMVSGSFGDIRTFAQEIPLWDEEASAEEGFQTKLVMEEREYSLPMSETASVSLDPDRLPNSDLFDRATVSRFRASWKAWHVERKTSTPELDHNGHPSGSSDGDPFSKEWRRAEEKLYSHARAWEIQGAMTYQDSITLSGVRQDQDHEKEHLSVRVDYERFLSRTDLLFFSTRLGTGQGSIGTSWSIDIVGGLAAPPNLSIELWAGLDKTPTAQSNFPHAGCVTRYRPREDLELSFEVAFDSLSGRRRSEGGPRMVGQDRTLFGIRQRLGDRYEAGLRFGFESQHWIYTQKRVEDHNYTLSLQLGYYF